MYEISTFGLSKMDKVQDKYVWYPCHTDKFLDFIDFILLFSVIPGIFLPF